MPKDQGTEQGDVHGPVECSLALEMVAARNAEEVAAKQSADSFPRIGVDDTSEEQRLQSDDFQLGGLEKLNAERALQKNEGLADLWYMDDCDIMCHPILVPSFLQEFDVANAQSRSGAESRKQKSSTTRTTLLQRLLSGKSTT